MDTNFKPVGLPTQPKSPLPPRLPEYPIPSTPPMPPGQSIPSIPPTPSTAQPAPIQSGKPIQSEVPIPASPAINLTQKSPSLKLLPAPNSKAFIPHQNRHSLYIALGIGASLVTVLIALVLMSQRVSFFSSARTPSSQQAISKENSYIFISPISAFADGISIIRVTVFMLSNQGLGVSGQTVKLKTSGPLTVSQVKPVTDDYGRAIFDVTSNNPGNYTLSAGTGDLSLSQTVSISFQ